MPTFSVPLLLLLACGTALPPSKDDSVGANLDSADSDTPGESGDDSSCIPAEEIAYDGIDQDCDGSDLVDIDGDGHDAAIVGGDDCLDTDASIYAGAVEAAYDGIDQDCSGADLTDVDGDGHDATIVGGDDCLDGDPASYQGAAEVAYDGIDQDCSGADLTDADGDGHDGAAVGGDDCWDSDDSIYPGAPEIPYDGIDQDCSGDDVVDADGDGFDGTAVGGDDCDDSDPSSHPGGTEVHGDGGDNDCDGRVDEYLTCWDGTGDFTTVQEGVDGTPDGGTLEICSGTYVETISIVDRVITIEGDDPLGVLISWNFEGDWTRLLSVSGASDVEISSLSLEANSYCLYYLPDVVPVRLNLIDFSQCDEPFESYSGSAGLSVERSFFTGSPDGSGALVGTSTFRQNIINATGTSFGLGLGGTSTTMENNLFIGGTIGFGIGGAEDRASVANVVLRNNTIADTDRMDVVVSVADGQIPPNVSIYNNIIGNFRFVNGFEYPFYYVSWMTPSSRYSVNPTAESNMFPDDGGALAEVYQWSDADWAYVINEALTSDAEAAVLVGGWRLDPEFTEGPMGSYGLAVSSPAVDAGVGDPDSDGSPADLGAFGGPNGDWWSEVPWPLP